MSVAAVLRYPLDWIVFVSRQAGDEFFRFHGERLSGAIPRMHCFST
jgi:hypothetical protein